MNEAKEPSFQVGDIVLGKVFRVDPEDGLYVRFGGPGDGFVPVDELQMSNMNPDFGFEYSVDNTYWLEIVDLDNTERPIQLSEITALRTIKGDGINTKGIRGEYTHFTDSGSPKQRWPNREVAMQRINEIRQNESWLALPLTNAKPAPTGTSAMTG